MRTYTKRDRVQARCYDPLIEDDCPLDADIERSWLVEQLLGRDRAAAPSLRRLNTRPCTIAPRPMPGQAFEPSDDEQT